MTDTRRPKPCHHDPNLGYRVTTTPTGDTEPCTATHCIDCGRTHTTPTQPLVCPDCIGRTRTNLDEIRWYARMLRWHAARAGHDGHLVAGAPIPGGDAMILLARAGAGHDDLIVDRHDPRDDHDDDDLVPVLLPLLGWEHQWRTHLSHPPRTTGRSPVTAITHYLTDHLTRLANTTDGPDWLGFAHDMAALRRQLEGVLHDEQNHQLGVPCFECGDRLVRTFGAPRPCRHRTPARDHIAQVRRDATTARAHVAQVRAAGDTPSYAELRAARRVPTSGEETAARRPCKVCVASTTGQGGIKNPAVGQSWECLGCHREYTPGEYANAVRSHLLQAGPNGDGWTHVQMAAEAATTQTGVTISPLLVRKWMERLKVRALCRWAPGVASGLRLVYWPDVADAAAAAVARAYELEQERAQRAAEAKVLADARDAGLDVAEAGRRHGIHPNRVRAIVDGWGDDAPVSA